MAQMIEEDGPITYSAVLTPGEDGWICALGITRGKPSAPL